MNAMSVLALPAGATPTSAATPAATGGSAPGGGPSAAAANALGALNSNSFLTLLVTQLQNQDPTQPMDSTAFVSQLAQFSQVTGIQQLQTSFSNLAQSLTGSQALQAATLVGHGVMAPSATAALSGSALAGAVTVPNAASDVVVQITDASGSAVRTLDLGPQNAGSVGFRWDGKSDAGTQMPDGVYGIRAAFQTGGGAPQAAATCGAGLVQSVSLGSNGQPPTLNVLGLGSVSLAQVQQIL